jgi:outer membrane protein assembly factor BamB
MNRIVIFALGVALTATAAEWPQFGGPSRDFTVNVSAPLGTAAPRKVWMRELGEGYSGISVDGPMLYTMYRRGNQEVAIALDANTGKTVWEHAYDAPIQPGMNMDNGPGPHATPLLSPTAVYTTGILGTVHAFDKKTGKVQWKKELLRDLNAKMPDRGYACSPLAYKNTLIFVTNAPGASVAALNPKDGAILWKKHDFTPSPTSPTLIRVSGQDQVLYFAGDRVIGISPDDGTVFWSHPHATDWGLNISLPVWGNDNILFISSAYKGGSRALALTRSGNATSVKELWATNQMRLHHSSAVRMGDHVYGSSGDFGPAPFTAIDVKTGKVAWRDRGVSKANVINAGGKLILLDEDGNLAVATATPQGLTIASKTPLLTKIAWTAPSLAGTKLYARDRKSIAAVALN